MAQKEEQEKAKKDTGSSKFKWTYVILVVGILLAVGATLTGTAIITKKLIQEGIRDASVNGTASAEKKSHKKQKMDPPEYFVLNPVFVTNLQDKNKQRYLQINVQVMARDSEAIEAVKLHMPVIRNNLTLLFSSKNSKELNNRSGIEKLREETLSEIHKILMENLGREGIEEVYFTSFVIQ
ncbi:MAG: flagellar basal body-associated FliL family protein [Thermodesulfobacteriota bacterium]|nr:flagellar basal body-associated FliL family protein [Thermodesulfobacteriota bacterium]